MVNYNGGGSLFLKRIATALGLSLVLIFNYPLEAKGPSDPTYRGAFFPVELIPDPSDHPPAINLTPAPTLPPRIVPKASPIIVLTPTGDAWQYDPEVSWYGPGFYGNRTACGLAYTTTILGVAHRSLPCGTLVEFRWNDKNAIVPVIDRGPYVDDRQWDLSGGLCVFLDHCFTGPIEWRLVK